MDDDVDGDALTQHFLTQYSMVQHEYLRARAGIHV